MNVPALYRCASWCPQMGLVWLGDARRGTVPLLDLSASTEEGI